MGGEGEGKYKPPGAETWKAPEKGKPAADDRRRTIQDWNKLETRLETPTEAHERYFREQLDHETVSSLLNLDIANNPEATAHLLQFLKAMGMNAADFKMKDFKDSRVMQHLRGMRDFKKQLEQLEKMDPEALTTMLGLQIA